MTSLDTCKAISEAFNTSFSYDEFYIKLDLAGLTIDEAETVYSKANKFLLKHRRQWCIDGKISFSKVFSDFDYANIVLPYQVKLTKHRIIANAMVHGHTDIKHHATFTDESTSFLLLHEIDIFQDLVSTILYELSAECTYLRKQGFSHGKE